MKLLSLFEKLESSKTFKEFKKNKETKNSFLCAGFFILNIKQNMFEYSLDFRNDKEIFTFKIQESGEVIMQKEELIQSRKQLSELKIEEIKKIKVDIEDIQTLLEKTMKENKIENPIEEIISVLQNSEENNTLIWNITCIASGFTIISFILDALTGKIKKFQKKNLLDFVSVKKPKA